jgi:hypothetical protein
MGIGTGAEHEDMELEGLTRGPIRLDDQGSCGRRVAASPADGAAFPVCLLAPPHEVAPRIASANAPPSSDLLGNQRVLTDMTL